jgi:drug/metabolite transporter (DMT)-like permease
MTHSLRGIFALLIVTLVWGTTFPAMKDLTDTFSAGLDRAAALCPGRPADAALPVRAAAATWPRARCSGCCCFSATCSRLKGWR